MLRTEWPGRVSAVVERRIQGKREAGFRGDWYVDVYPYLEGPVREGTGCLDQRARFIVLTLSYQRAHSALRNPSGPVYQTSKAALVAHCELPGGATAQCERPAAPVTPTAVPAPTREANQSGNARVLSLTQKLARTK